MVRNKNMKKQKLVDTKQPSLLDYSCNGIDKELMMNRITNENMIRNNNIKAESDKNAINDSSNLRSEQIHIPYNEKISKLCKLSNNLYNEACT